MRVVRVLAIRQTSAGTEADLEWQGKQYLIKAPLYGEHHGMNLALAFATAAVMGIAPDSIAFSLSDSLRNGRGI